jgi:5-(carboxyamino)imidazole ribonucleotide mutase
MNLSHPLPEPPLDFTQITGITFDCYGTLIDWESGILDALRPVFARAGRDLDEAEVLESFAKYEAEAEQGRYRTYRMVLKSVMEKLNAQYKLRVGPKSRSLLVNSMSDWKPFPDTVEVLRDLSKRFKLGIVSNVDDRLFVKSRIQLNAPFQIVVTAQQMRMYKPGLRGLDLAFRTLGDGRRQNVLHVAQSLYHDIEPANRLGAPTVWVNRRKGKPGFGATPPAQAKPTLTVTNLRELWEMIEGKRPQIPPVVGVVMGSQSDWETMQHTAETLERLGIAFETRIVSAHRTPDLLFEYAETARDRDMQVIIAGAGGAAHLPGMLAAKTSVPVLGVPVQSKALNGMDSLLSIVQMPAGVPVGTLAIGRAGAINAALLAASIVGNKRPEVADALDAFRREQTQKVLDNPDPSAAE